ncbi:rhodanese-like domain-containing protein [Roseisolibacter agri]|uniref:Sulfurtransferase n=1 Tax=Roseisolibacter agri TaxID=2014610 RepID=A0AA37V1S9_9BACT|nr:rhodanese-like domain-containing protein [Roseisolibacter agri]GLC24237.1 sulfurtransferase [Roseisolibacter agri]
MKTYHDLVAEAKPRITEVSADDVRARLAQGESFTLLDIREPNEWKMGHLPGALHIPRGVMESAIESRVPREQEVVLYCASGNRSVLAADVLQQMGYRKVSSMRGGIRAWADAGGEVE